MSNPRVVTPEDVRRDLDVWFEYLAPIYPVATLLDAASVTDKGAAAARNVRMTGALLAGLTRIFANLAKAGARRRINPTASTGGGRTHGRAAAGRGDGGGRPFSGDPSGR